MLDLKKLMEQLKAVLESMEAAAADMEKEGVDEAGKTAAKKIYDAKSLEYTQLESKIEEAKKHAQRHARLKEVEQLASVAPQGKTIPAGAVPAEAKNEEAEQLEEVKQFENFICSGGKHNAVSAWGLDRLSPQGSGWKDGKTGLKVPKKLLVFVAPYRGKALPMSSVSATGQELRFTEYKPELLMYPGEAPAIFPRTNQIPTKTGKIIYPRLKQSAGQFGGVVVAWTAEASDKPAAEPQFEQLSIECFEISAYTELSNSLLNRSAINLPALLQNLFKPALLDGIDTAIISGDGNGKPTGILNEAGIGNVVRAAGNQVAYNDLLDMEGALLPQFRARATWKIVDTALTYIKKLKDSQQRPLFIPALEKGMPPTLIGYPVIPTQRQPALGTAGDVILSDDSQYIAPVEEDVVIAASEHYKFRQGVTAFVAYAQVGGRAAQVKAFVKLT